MDEPTVFGKRAGGGPPAPHTTSGHGDILRPQRTEHRLLRWLLPLFALGAGAAGLAAEVQNTASWYERFVLLPSAFLFIVLLGWSFLTPPHKVARLRASILVVVPAIALTGWGRQLWDLHRDGFDPSVYLDLSPWLIFCAALFIFLLPARSSWKFAAGYYLLSLAMLGGFSMTNQKALPPTVVSEFLINIVIAPLIFIVLLSAFTKLRSDYARARAHASDMRDLAMHDRLTQLPNRHAFMQSFRRAKARQARNQTPLCAMLLDIDHFKRINDTYGHQVGDDVLVRLAGVLARELRGTDEVFRWGGEEFLVLLEETPLKHLGEVAERLREAVETAPLLEGVKVTISIGATHVLPGEDEIQVNLRADRGLYASKEAGRNRVTVVEASARA